METLRSIRSLKNVGAGYLAEYCATTSGFAWPEYDIDRCPEELVPTDVLAPAFLSYPIRGQYIQQMFRQPSSGSLPNSFARLLEAMQTVVEDGHAKKCRYEGLSNGELDDRDAPGWGKVLRAIDEVQHCSGLTSVAVTKILHRKRPQLVPINDSLLRDFYGVKHAGYSAFFREVHRDLNESREQLDKWVLPYTEGRPAMTRLRCLDIVIWMHQRSAT